MDKARLLEDERNSQSFEQQAGITISETTYCSRFQRTSPNQFNVMVEFMERHGDLSRPGVDRQEVELKWKELADKLNENVAKKPWDRWKKVWADLKNNTKRKAATVIRNPDSKCVLTPLEQRVLAFHYGVSNVGPMDAKRNLMDLGHDPVVPVVKEENENSDETTYYVILHEEMIRDQLSQPRSLHTTSPAPPSTRSRSTSPDQPASPTFSPSLPLTPPPGSPPSPAPPPRLPGDPGPAPAPAPPAPATRRQLPHSTIRRRRRQSCQQTNLYIALEHRRLRLEELKVRNQHERERERERNLHERETERLKLDAKRLELEARRLELHAEESTVMRRLDAWLDRGPKL